MAFEPLCEIACAADVQSVVATPEDVHVVHGQMNPPALVSYGPCPPEPSFGEAHGGPDGIQTRDLCRDRAAL